MNSKRKKKLIFTISYIIILILATIAFTYAAFTFSKKGTVENTLETGTVTLTYTEGKTGITLNEAYPMSDDKGKVLIGENNVFDFTVQANLSRTMSIGYEVTAVKIPITDVTPLEDNEVKLYLERAIDPDTNYSEVLAPSTFVPREEQSEIGSPKGSMILDSGTFRESGTTIHHYRLRMWVDENTIIPSGESRKYGVKINVYAKQDINFIGETYNFDTTTGTIMKYNGTEKNVMIPSQIDSVEVTTIGTSAFSNKSLNSVNIPEGVTTIEENAFSNNNLTSVTIPETITSIGTNAFSNNPLNEINNLSENTFNWQDITGKDDIVVNSPRNKNITHIWKYNQAKDSSTFCVTGEESTCVEIEAPSTYEAGTIIKYKVNDTEEKYFHVMFDEGDTLTLQQRENTVYDIEWYSVDDNTKGPLTILPVLEETTSGWTNVLEQTYTLGTTVFKDNAFTGCRYDGTNKIFDCTTNTYALVERTAKARMITVQEANSLGCTNTNQSCPIWMYNYLYDVTSYGGTVNQTGGEYGYNGAYWTMNVYPGSYCSVWEVYYSGAINYYNSNYTSRGARAVVVIEK